MNNITTTFVLDKRRTLENGTHPVKLRMTYLRKSRMFSVVDEHDQSVSLDPSSFDKIRNGTRLSTDLRAVRKVIFSNIEKADETVQRIVQNNPPFEFYKYDQLTNRRVKYHSIAGIFDLIIDENVNEERYGNASTYATVKHSLQDFLDIDNLHPREVNVKFLKAFEHFLINSRGLSYISVSSYMRTLRAMVNRAINMSILDRNYYPFGRGRYMIPRQAARKKALPKADAIKLIKLKLPKHSSRWYAHQYFLLSMYCNGMNFGDIAELKKTDYNGEWITFYRRKTKTTSSTKKQIRVAVVDEIKAIINNLKADDGIYLFPILDDRDDAKRQREVRQQFIQNTNKAMKKIAAELDIDPKISTNYARHTFATLHKQKGTNIMMISDAMGHTSIKTTQIYFDSFDDDALRDMNKGLFE
ncbi:MAG: site-specific integrase [Cyclobacteriaceae bacterium]